MIDLATLNLKIDSSEVREGVGQLDKLTAAGTRAEAATDRLEAGFDSAAVSAAKLTQAETRLVAANDRFGASMRGASNVTRAMQANMLNLTRQGADVATMFALGAPPMQIFASQGLQIVDVLAMMNAEAKATNTSLGAMGAQGMARLGPYALAAAAGGLALAAALETVTDRINENSRVTVTWQDVVLGSLDAVAAFARDQVTAAFESMGVDVGEVWHWLTGTIAAEINRQIGHVMLGVNLAKAAWSTFPGAIAEYFVDAVNAAIQAMERLVNAGIDGLNNFANTVNSVIGREVIGELSRVDFGEVENAYRGAGARAGTALGSAVANSYRDYLGAAADFIDPFVQNRAETRLAAEAAGDDAGKAMGRAAGREVRREVRDALKDAAKEAAELADIIAGKNEQAAQAQAEADRNLQNKLKAEVEVQERVNEEARRLEEDRIRDMADMYQALFSRGIDGIWDYFKRQGMETLANLASQGVMRLLSGGSSAGGGGGGILGLLGGTAANDNGAQPTGLLSLLGSSGAPLAAGGPVGAAVAAAALAFSIGKSISSALSSPKGVANLSGTSILGSFGKLSGQATDAGGSVLDTIAQIADALGTTASGGAVSVGIKGKNFRVDPTGQGRVKGAGVIDFGKDQQAAIEYAIRDLIQDGVLGGISQAAKNLLGAGGDLEKAIEQATLIESMPKLLKARLDPLGAALDDIDQRFGKLVDALRAGGATAQQFADAEKLYNLERQDAIAQIGSAAQTLKDFAASLAYGSNSPLSVRSQLASAEAAFAPFQQAILAGQTIDQEKFTSAAQTLLGLSRQANGSSGEYFATFDRINSLTQQAIGNVESGSSVQGPGLVFQQQTASNTATMAQMLQDHTALLQSIDAKLGANDNGGKNSKFIGGKRGFGT